MQNVLIDKRLCIKVHGCFVAKFVLRPCKWNEALVSQALHYSYWVPGPVKPLLSPCLLIVYFVYYQFG